jgi:hypothetical protein
MSPKGLISMYAHFGYNELMRSTNAFLIHATPVVAVRRLAAANKLRGPNS